MKCCVFNLGCKVNEYESEAIAAGLAKNNHEVTQKLEVADVYIINTCAVTNEALRKSRNIITKCNKLNSKCKIFVVGCGVQNNADKFIGASNVVYVNGVAKKSDVLSLVESFEVSSLPDVYEDNLNYKNTKTRAFIKVQDGCNNFCSYCIVPYLRGKSRSRDINSIISEISLLGCVKEVVLCGINLSDYNKDCLGSLADAVNGLGIRFRFGSLEVNVINNEFLRRLSKLENFCPQFHLSLQSGSDKVLKDMNRHYNRYEYLDAVKNIKETFSNASITTDIIVGFPTESESDYLESEKMIVEAGFLDVHIFPYSKREGTNAAKLSDLNGAIKADRAGRLSKVKDQIRAEVLRSFVHSIAEVLIETAVDGYMVGYTKNYILTYIKGCYPTNSLINVKIIELYKDGVLAEVVKGD